MAELLNNYSGGTPTDEITDANSGGASGDAFDAVSAPSSARLISYDDAAIFPEVAQTAKVHVESTFATMVWDSSWTPTTTTWVREYLRASLGAAANNHVIYQFLNASDGTVCDVQWSTTGAIRLRAPTTLRYTSTKTFGNNEPFRIEVYVESSTTVGKIQARLFWGDNIHGETPDEVVGSLSDNWNTGAELAGWQKGLVANPGDTRDLWMGYSAISDVDWIGPAFEGADKLDVPAGFTFDRTSGLREVTAAWSAVDNAEGYRLEVDELVPDGDPEDEEDWTEFVPPIDTDQLSVVLDDADGIDWATTYRARVRALAEFEA